MAPPPFDVVQVPKPGQPVHKDECMFSFDTPESEGGLFVCLRTYQAACKEHIERLVRLANNKVFLHIKTHKKKIEQDQNQASDETAPTKMAIGVEGGFDVEEKYEYTHEYSLAVFPELALKPLDGNDFPMIASMAAKAVIERPSATRQEEVAAWEEHRPVSKHAENLLQLDNGIKVPPSGHKCQECDLTDNLWLNLTDGSILCGRRNFDGSGGNNHAVEHYAKTKHPLAVKLGTITKDGADVFSYEEDDMVQDPHLEKHLAHFGIDIAQMRKTSKTMAELEIEANMSLKFEFSQIQESGFKLKPLYGPGFTGMLNLGNSCYMNSVVQVLFSLPEFQKLYFDGAASIFDNASLEDVDSLDFQTAKLACGLLSGKYSKPLNSEGEEDGEQQGIAPRLFKSVVGRGHPEFSTNQQQDAAEYFSHLMELLSRSSRTAGHGDPSGVFRFEYEQRVQCNSSRKVRYTDSKEMLLQLPVSEDMAINTADVEAFKEKKAALEAEGKEAKPEDVVRPIIPLTACVDQVLQPSVIEDWYSPAIKSKTTCTRQLRFKSFPKYLVCVAQRFYVGDDWTAKKHDVALDVPDELDLTRFVAKGRQDDEEEMPEDDAADEVVIDDAMVQQLASMGFPYEGCRKAVFHNPDSVEQAMEWVMQHMGDPDFASPFVPPGRGGASAGGGNVDEEAIAMLESMGFPRRKAMKALRETDNNLERATEWIFSHPDDDGEDDGTAEQDQEPAPQGSGRYKLKAFISHMGTSAHAGHYVCHIIKDGQWTIFNDRKVAQSVKPPRELAYMYLYESV